MKFSIVKMLPAVLALTVATTALAAPDAAPVSNLPNGQGNPATGNAATNNGSTPAVVSDTTRPPVPPFCQNMSPEQCHAMMSQMKQQMLQKWQNMTPEQKQAMQQQMQQKWQAMTPQEKQMVKEKMLRKWQAMAPQDQQEVMQQMQSTQTLATPADTSAKGSGENAMIQQWQSMSPQDRENVLQQMQTLQHQLPDPTPSSSNAAAATTN